MKKHLLSKYLLCSAVTGALALAPSAVKAQTTTTTTTTTMTSAEPMAVSGSVVRYYTDRTGYVTAMDVQTANGVQMVHFPANRAANIYGMYPTGGNIDVWVTPNKMMGTGHWNAVGVGTQRPTVWWNTLAANDIGWLEAEPYINVGARETRVRGRLKGVVTNRNNEVLALAIENSDGWSLVRVPPENRQISPNPRGDVRITPLFKNAVVEAVGVPEAPRAGGLGTYSRTLAAGLIRVNGDTVGAIGLPSINLRGGDSLLDWNIDGNMNAEMNERDLTVYRRGYRGYVPMGTTAGDMGTGGTRTTTQTTTRTSETATGRVMVVAADGTMMPVVRQNNKLWIQSADGSVTELKKTNSKYMVPASMAGARMMMVMADGRRLDMDTVNGQLMVMMADGSMAPVQLHTP